MVLIENLVTNFHIMYVNNNTNKYIKTPTCVNKAIIMRRNINKYFLWIQAVTANNKKQIAVNCRDIVKNRSGPHAINEDKNINEEILFEYTLEPHIPL